MAVIRQIAAGILVEKTLQGLHRLLIGARAVVGLADAVECLVAKLDSGVFPQQALVGRDSLCVLAAVEVRFSEKKASLRRPFALRELLQEALKLLRCQLVELVIVHPLGSDKGALFHLEGLSRGHLGTDENCGKNEGDQLWLTHGHRLTPLRTISTKPLTCSNESRTSSSDKPVSVING